MQSSPACLLGSHVLVLFRMNSAFSRYLIQSFHRPVERCPAVEVK